MSYVDKMVKIEKLFKEVDDILINKKEEPDNTEYGLKDNIKEDKDNILAKLKSVFIVNRKENCLSIKLLALKGHSII